MSKDITPIISGWDYDSDDLQVRIVAGADSRDKIQMRIDLGLIQMEMEGRPDGLRPNEFESLLDWYESRVASGDLEGLDGDDCAPLMREGIQYYHRYLAAFHLNRYDIVARDTARNLRLFAFVNQHAGRQRDKVQFDRYRPYVLMMRTRALGLEALSKEDHAAAIEAIDEGVEKLREFLREYEQADNEAECMELVFLLRWRREIESERPVGPLEILERQLKRAVSLEEYEEAARVRDQLQRLRGVSDNAGPESSSMVV